MTDAPVKVSVTVQQAKTRLDSALTHLEKAVAGLPAARGDAGAGGDAERERLARELEAARAEIAELKQKNATVTARLDAAIGDMRELINE